MPMCLMIDAIIVSPVSSVSLTLDSIISATGIRCNPFLKIIITHWLNSCVFPLLLAEGRWYLKTLPFSAVTKLWFGFEVGAVTFYNLCVCLLDRKTEYYSPEPNDKLDFVHYPFCSAEFRVGLIIMSCPNFRWMLSQLTEPKCVGASRIQHEKIPWVERTSVATLWDWLWLLLFSLLLLRPWF